MTKTCSRCKETKDLIAFYKQTALRLKDDGYDYYCKLCRNKAAYKSWNNNKSKCTEEGCSKASYSRQICRVHYNTALRHQKKRNENAKAKLQPYPPQGADNA